MAGQTSRGFVATSLGQVHYRRSGSGFPVVLLHRTPDSSTMWDDITPTLAQHFRVVALDTPGFGDSDAPNSPPDIADYARNVVETLAGLGIERFHLVGHRTGSTIANEVAAAYPAQVQRLVLSGLVNYPPDDRRPTIEVAVDQEVRLDGSHYSDRWAVVRNAWPWGTPEQIHRTVIDALRASPTWRWAGEAVRRYTLDDRAPLVQAPVLLLYGETDRFKSWIPALQSVFPTMTSHVFPGGHDLTMLQMPGEFSRVVTAFLNA